MLTDGPVVVVLTDGCVVVVLTDGSVVWVVGGQFDDVAPAGAVVVAGTGTLKLVSGGPDGTAVVELTTPAVT